MKYRIRPFGIPAWLHCKRRVAKKYINRRKRDLWKRFKEFHDYNRDLISDCSGLNTKPDFIEPNYKCIGKKGYVLFDLDFEGPQNSCSFYHCGVGLPKTYEECVGYVKQTIERWKDNKGGWDFADRYSKLILHVDGTFDWGK